jgi:hypothetical protein
MNKVILSFIHKNTSSYFHCQVRSKETLSAYMSLYPFYHLISPSRQESQHVLAAQLYLISN